MVSWIHRAVLLPAGDIGRHSQQGYSFRCSRHLLPADVTQCSIDRRRIHSYAAIVLPATGVPVSWNSDAVVTYTITSPMAALTPKNLFNTPFG